ncbi:MAG: hypothetical protein FIA92_18000 [Chloroflexi bacterium]|nr:hypothetical protein [Chloroflexota bacterium]
MAERAAGERRGRLDWAGVVPLVAGLVAVAAAMVAGVSGDLLELLARPPDLVRAVLAGSAILAGLVLLRGALSRLAATGELAPGQRMSNADLRRMVRGVRSIFLAAAAFSAAGGWLVGHPLPIVVGLVIAGVDVIETSLLLLVAGSRRGG